MIHIKYYDSGLENILSDYEAIFKVLKNKKLTERTMNILRLVESCNNLYEIASL